MHSVGVAMDSYAKNVRKNQEFFFKTCTAPKFVKPSCSAEQSEHVV